jgi:serine/threonine-protein kinase RsbW
VRSRGISLLIESDLANVALVGDAVRALCARHGEAHEIELCVVEAVNNAIRHAYQDAPGHEVEVRVDLDAAATVIEVRDGGRAMPAGALATAAAPCPPALDAADVAALPEGGFGLSILRRLMDEIRYETRAGVNVLTLVRRLPRGDEP